MGASLSGRSWAWARRSMVLVALVEAGCLAAPADSGGSPDGGGGTVRPDDAGEAVAACEPLDVADNFNDGFGDVWDAVWENEGGMLGMDGGRAMIDLLSAEQSRYAGINSVVVDGRDRCATVEVISMISTEPDSQAEAYAALQPPSGYPRAYIRQRTGDIHCGLQSVGGGLGTDLFTASYDEDLHRWWRLRTQGDVVHCDTSPDGESWQVLGQVESPYPLSSTSFSVSAGTYGYMDEPGTLVFDNVNR